MPEYSTPCFRPAARVGSLFKHRRGPGSCLFSAKLPHTYARFNSATLEEAACVPRALLGAVEVALKLGTTAASAREESMKARAERNCRERNFSGAVLGGSQLGIFIFLKRAESAACCSP